jgi:hypothetical protein
MPKDPLAALAVRVHDASHTLRDLVAVNFMLRDLVASLLDEVAAQDPARYRRIASSLHWSGTLTNAEFGVRAGTSSASKPPYDLEGV